DERTAFVEIPGGAMSMRTVVEALKGGDEVLVGRHAAMILGKMPRRPVETAAYDVVNVDWAHIGGQAEAVAAMRDAVEVPILHGDLLRAYGRRPSKGVLLYGPPGNGKTLLGKAAATAIAKLHGKTSGGFTYVKGPELLSMWVGQTEKAIRVLFGRAREYAAEHGVPMTLFFDECDSLMGRRGGQISSD